MNTEISESVIATMLGLGMQILELPAHRKLVPAGCHAHSNAHKRPQHTNLATAFNILYKFK